MNSKKFIVLALALLIVGALAGIAFLQLASSPSGITPTAISSQNSNTLPGEARFSKLGKGINLSRWYTDPLEPDKPDFLSNFVTQADIKLLREKGFNHVRLPIDPVFFFNEKTPEMLDPYMTPRLDAALDMILLNDMAVIVDFHPLNKEYKRRLAREAGLRASLVKSWATMAKHLSGRNPELLFLETLNEPAFEETFTGDGKTTAEAVKLWWEFQKELVAAIRANAPQHTIIANTHEYGLVSELATMEKANLQPLADKNVVYNLHFYLPFYFTHQAADWALKPGEADYWKNIPYPATTQTCREVKPALTADEKISRFCAENWDKNRLEAEIRPAYEFAQRYKVRLTFNEFGVYRQAPAPFRNAWLRDTRQIFEQFGFGWTMWDYADGFGLMLTDSKGQRSVDPLTLKALGL